MFRQIGGNYYNDEKFEKIITTDGKNYVVFDGGNRLEIDDDDFQAIIENGWIRIGGTHYNPALIAKIAEDRYDRKYAEFTNGEHMPLSDTEWDDIIEENGEGTGGGVVDIVLEGVTLKIVTAADSGEEVAVLDIPYDYIKQACDAEAAGQDARFVYIDGADAMYIDLTTDVSATTVSASFWTSSLYCRYTGTISDESVSIRAYQFLFRQVPAVLTIEQTLTAEQQAQVLTNLGIVDAQNIAY